MINILIPVTFIPLFPGAMFVLIGTCTLWGFLGTPKTIVIVSNKRNDSITLSYDMPISAFNFTTKRKLSDLIDLRTQVQRSKSKNGNVRTVGHLVFLVFKNRDDQVVFLVRGDDNQHEIIMNDLDTFALNG